MTEQPYFDDTRAALTFALNFKGQSALPVMSRILAQMQTVPRKVGKAKRARYMRQFAHDPDLAMFVGALLDGELGKRMKRTPDGPARPHGLDAAHLAGFVLAHFARLSDVQQMLLRGRVLEAYNRCACGSPCCSGWRRQPAWAEAVTGTCLHLEKVGDILREPGKRGLSTQPQMRLALVEQFYTRNEMTLVELARIGSVSLTTAAKHKEWVYTYLEQEENSAWTELDLMFDAAGITGAFV